MKVLAIMNMGLKAFFPLATCFLLQGCVSTSLEDAAPQDLSLNSLPNTSDTPPMDENKTIAAPRAVNTEIPAKYDEQGFPTFAETPQGAVAQLSYAEKLAIETKMTELLRSRSTDANVKANFDAKLQRLRKLAKTHEQNADAIISQ